MKETYKGNYRNLLIKIDLKVFGMKNNFFFDNIIKNMNLKYNLYYYNN